MSTVAEGLRSLDERHETVAEDTQETGLIEMGAVSQKTRGGILGWLIDTGLGYWAYD